MAGFSVADIVVFYNVTAVEASNHFVSISDLARHPSRHSSERRDLAFIWELHAGGRRGPRSQFNG
jgi:hypothetical protein